MALDLQRRDWMETNKQTNTDEDRQTPTEEVTNLHDHQLEQIDLLLPFRSGFFIMNGEIIGESFKPQSSSLPEHLKEKAQNKQKGEDEEGPEEHASLEESQGSKIISFQVVALRKGDQHSSHN